MNFKDFLKQNIVLLDGATGTMILKKRNAVGKFPERLNVTDPELLVSIHTEYFDAGSNVVCTNTFGANALKYSDDELDEIVKCAVENAKKARESSIGKQEKFVALDIGPTGKMLKPFGDLDFEDAVNVFKKTVALGVKYGVDLVIVETMNDSYETKAAVLAVKESSDLPVLVSNAYGGDGKLLSGSSPDSMVAILEGLKVDGLGANCSLGPHELYPVIEKILARSSTPVIFKPNAGLPAVVDGKTVYNVDEEEFADSVYDTVKKGVRIVGGCCGTTPDYIKALNEKIKGLKPVPVTPKNDTVVSSYCKCVDFDKPVVIGERINPTGKKRLKQAIMENDFGYVSEEAVNQQKAGADILDVNVGIPEVDESLSLVGFVKEIQSVTDLPLQIDTVSEKALEKTLRIYNGKALINSVNGKAESMEAVFPLAKKYGGVVVALTLDEKGIPETAEERIRIAEKIVNKAKEYGITTNDLLFDTLTLTVANQKNSAQITLKALSELNKRGYKTVLGVSNVSFGLPERQLLNASFFTSALTLGLNAGIINPYSEEMMKAYYSFRALHGYDENFDGYVSFATGVEKEKSHSPQTENSLTECIKKGLKEQAKVLTEKLLLDNDAIKIINENVIPALDSVGRDYESKKIFLPQLLISAESAKASFDVIASKNVKGTKKKSKIVLATVKGDIHDIGKNIVKMMLENYGFNVIDLGKDVDPEVIVKTVVKEKAPVCGLSALMTTTVPYMKETIELLKKDAPFCKTVVGGAVLTEEYALSIGADKYAKDALETVRFMEKTEKDKF